MARPHKRSLARSVFRRRCCRPLCLLSFPVKCVSVFGFSVFTVQTSERNCWVPTWEETFQRNNNTESSTSSSCSFPDLNLPSLQKNVSSRDRFVEVKSLLRLDWSESSSNKSQKWRHVNRFQIWRIAELVKDSLKPNQSDNEKCKNIISRTKFC